MTMTMTTTHTGTTKALPGVPFPLGAQYDGTGTNFSVFSEVAERIELCLFEEDGRETRINMTERDGYNWHEYLTGVGPGQQYGFRVYGPWDPQKGIRCCPNKLLLDLVTCEQKHNEANLENNNDGTDDNRSCNYGAEGETDDPAINDVRARQARDFLTTLLLSQGVPMILGGDEIGRTQHGNHNAYCQDNELTWYDWEHADANLKEFTTRLIELRRDHPVFRRRGWYQGRSIRGSAMLDDIGWFRPDASGMSEDDWKQGYIKTLQIFLNGDLGYVDKRGEPVQDNDFLVLVNAAQEDMFFQLALSEKERPWEIVLNTSTRLEDGEEGEKQSDGLKVKAKGRSVIVLTRPRK